MVSTSGRKNTIIENLLAEPKSFDFFQVVRLLVLTIYQNQSLVSQKDFEIGPDILFKKIFIRFRTLPKCAFPVGLVEKIEIDSESHNEKHYFAQLWVTFMGLTGPGGVLPHHYTELVAEQYQQGNHALLDFFDLFNHRILSLLYAAWGKYYFLIAYEREKNLSDGNDPFTSILASLAGVRSSMLRKNFSLPTDIISFYAGLFAYRVRSALGLEQLLGDYFELPIKILQFQGQWLTLNDNECSRISNVKMNANIYNQLAYNQLGKNCILGQRFCSIQNKFRLYLGPLTYDQFQQISPHGSLLKALIVLTHFYVGTEYNFDIQIELFAKAVPVCCLQKNNSMILGWNTWLQSQPFAVNDKQLIYNPVRL